MQDGALGNNQDACFESRTRQPPLKMAFVGMHATPHNKTTLLNKVSADRNGSVKN